MPKGETGSLQRRRRWRRSCKRALSFEKEAREAALAARASAAAEEVACKNRALKKALMAMKDDAEKVLGKEVEDLKSAVADHKAKFRDIARDAAALKLAKKNLERQIHSLAERICLLLKRICGSCLIRECV